MKKILVLGSNGMAGHTISRYFQDYPRSENYKVTTAARKDSEITFDAENYNSVEALINNIRETEYDYVINCVGKLVKDSIDYPDKALIVNAWFPKFLERNLIDSKTKIIHLSTDCVFDGATGGYTESHVPTETNAYGKSKAAGEIINQKDITFRMSIIGPDLKQKGSGLLNWFLNCSPNEVDGWRNAWWNGITTLQLAKCIDLYIQSGKEIAGLYHLVESDQSINKYELLLLINEIFNVNKKINISLGPKAINKVLADMRRELNWQIPSYRDQLLELKEWMNV